MVEFDGNFKSNPDVVLLSTHHPAGGFDNGHATILGVIVNPGEKTTETVFELLKEAVPHCLLSLQSSMVGAVLIAIHHGRSNSMAFSDET